MTLLNKPNDANWTTIAWADVHDQEEPIDLGWRILEMRK